ncbi:MAG: helix-turn-helix domain-containing protein [Candidatus Sedimenticola sp. 20ELBAFRAG]
MTLGLSGKYAFVPVEVFSDRALNLIDLRVLGALYSFRTGHANKVWPGRNAIGERCGYTPTTISRAVTNLVARGWIEVKQARGPNTYILKLPETVPEPETVSDSETVSKAKTVTKSGINSAQIGRPTVSDPATPDLINELNNELTLMHAGCSQGRFDEFWSEYPVKKNKKRSRCIWESRKFDIKADLIISDVKNRKLKDADWLKDGGKYIPHASTYLNGERWEDEFTRQQERISSNGLIQSPPTFQDGECY